MNAITGKAVVFISGSERMVRASKKSGNGGKTAEPNPEAEERKRLKGLALSNNLLSETPPKALCPVLSPSKTVLKHHGKDIVKKSQRKSRFLFSFPGLLAPMSGGKIGELKHLGTKNPILYLHFPQGRMKLFGTIVFPKNRYLTLQFSRGGKNVICEDYFDTMIVFSDAWWIGTEDENPEESELDFPEELERGQCPEYDFQGGAGSMSEKKGGSNKPDSGIRYAKEVSPIDGVEDDSLDDQNDMKVVMQTTPVRHSERTAGKKFNFTEDFSGDEFDENDDDTSEEEEKEDIMGFDIDVNDAATTSSSPLQAQDLSVSLTNNSKELSCSKHTSLVQPTISSLLTKAEEKKAARNPRKLFSLKVSGQKLPRTSSKQKIDRVKVSVERMTNTEEQKSGTGAKRRKQNCEVSTSVETVKVYQRKMKGRSTSAVSSSCQVEDDDIEEFQSTSEDTDGSDEAWVA